jgi:hypothetical protein
MQLTCDHCRLPFDPAFVKTIKGQARRKYCCQGHHDEHEDMLTRMTRRQREYDTQLELPLRPS